MARNPKAYIRIKGNAFDFKCYLGNERAKVTGGGAAYSGQRRPQADAATLFEGNELITMDVPVLFDGWPDKDIEPHVNQIYELCRGKNRQPPPSFIASGPIPFSGTRFQMALPEDNGSLCAPDGTLVRQALTLKLIEYNDPSSIRFRHKPGTSLGKSRSGGTEAPPNSIVLTRKENLLEVSSRVYGEPGMAHEIGRVNDIKDVRKKLPVGTRLKLPAGGPAFGIGPGQEV